ncbi:hypothetical protein ACHAXS_012106 [Conticribra weissflogii]
MSMGGQHGNGESENNYNTNHIKTGFTKHQSIEGPQRGQLNANFSVPELPLLSSIIQGSPLLTIVSIVFENNMKYANKIFVYILSSVLLCQLMAFSIHGFTLQNCAGIAQIRERSIENVDYYRQTTLLFAECSRRGFLGSCLSTVAAYSLVPAQSAKALTDTSNSNDATCKIIDSTISPNLIAKVNEKSTTTLQESISGFVSGSAVSTVKTLVKYPLDTATVRLQMPDTPFTLRNLPALFDGSFRGISAPLISNIPAGAIFFAVKDATKSSLKQSGLPKWATTSLAVAAALPPYWLIRNPSEVIKTRLQIGTEGYFEGMSTVDAFKFALSKGKSENSTLSGLSELYLGYFENILYGFPADIIKFVAYDYLSGGRKLSPADGAVYGALSTAIAQFATTPLDVLRNRIMADIETKRKGDFGDRKKTSYLERLSTIADEEGVSALFAGSSPRVAKAILSGALQFAAYEETKEKISEMFTKK